MILNKVKLKNSWRLPSFVFFFLIITASQAHAEKVAFSVDTDEGVVTAESLKGQLVYIDFWASWCMPCRKSFPWMNEMQKKYKDKNFTVLAINLDKDRALAEEFLEEFPVDFLIGYDPAGELAERFQITGMPMAYLMDLDGEFVHKHTGFKVSKVSEYESGILELLEASH